jgi:hypothetical protein
VYLLAEKVTSGLAGLVCAVLDSTRQVLRGLGSGVLCVLEAIAHLDPEKSEEVGFFIVDNE